MISWKLLRTLQSLYFKIICDAISSLALEPLCKICMQIWKRNKIEIIDLKDGWHFQNYKVLWVSHTFQRETACIKGHELFPLVSCAALKETSIKSHSREGGSPKFDVKQKLKNRTHKPETVLNVAKNRITIETKEKSMSCSTMKTSYPVIFCNV